MTMMRVCPSVVLLLINISGVDAVEDMKVCYVLDAILIAYSIILTVLYIRLKLYSTNKPIIHPEKTDVGVYAGLTPHISDTYETIRVEKKSRM